MRPIVKPWQLLFVREDGAWLYETSLMRPSRGRLRPMQLRCPPRAFSGQPIGDQPIGARHELPSERVAISWTLKPSSRRPQNAEAPTISDVHTRSGLPSGLPQEHHLRRLSG